MPVYIYGMKHNAFSLIELSIVLVILGLLTGGILTGQSLIRASELRAVSTEYNRFSTAALAFRDKYLALPGDMKNATQFWGIAAGTLGNDATCQNFASTTTATCNGDGDGTPNSGTSNERYRFWQHLANAGMIEGSYTGTAGSGGAEHHVIGSNAPASKLSNAGWTMDSNRAGFAGDAWLWAFPAGRYIFLKIGGPTTNTETYNRTLKPEEAWNIDVKIDDGKPGLGKLWTRFWDECTLATSNTNTSAEYDLTNSNRDCALYIQAPM